MRETTTGSWMTREHRSLKWAGLLRLVDCLDQGMHRKGKEQGFEQRLFVHHSQIKPVVKKSLKRKRKSNLYSHSLVLVVRMLKENSHQNRISESFHHLYQVCQDRSMLTFGNCIQQKYSVENYFNLFVARPGNNGLKSQLNIYTNSNGFCGHCLIVIVEFMQILLLSLELPSLTDQVTDQLKASFCLISNFDLIIHIQIRFLSPVHHPCLSFIDYNNLYIHYNFRCYTVKQCK